ncbi:MAG: hypothetical protein ACREKE_06260, partial [bacterium]
CPVSFFSSSNSTGQMTYEFKSGSSATWCPVILRDYVVPISSVSYCTGPGSGCTPATWQSGYNGWLPNSGSWGTIYLQITDYKGTVNNIGPISCCGPDPGPNSGDPASDWQTIAAPNNQLTPCVAGPSDTDTKTPTVGPTATDTPNYTHTPTPTPTPLPADCPYTLWGAATGTTTSEWTADSTQSTLAVSTAEVQSPAEESLEVTTEAAAGPYYQTIANLVPDITNWTGYTSITFDLYISSASLSAFTGGAGGYAQAEIRLTGSVIDPTGGQKTSLVAGWNALTFTLGPATGLNYNGINELLIIMNAAAAVAEPFYIDNVVLHTGAACPTATDTSTPSPTYSPTPASTSTFTKTDSPTDTDTLTNSPTSSVTETSSPTRTGTLTATSSPTEMSSPTRTDTLTATSTNTPSDTPSVTPSRTPSPTVS